MYRIAQHSKPTCRFSLGQKSASTDGILIDYPLSGSREPAEMDTIHCKSPQWQWTGAKETADLEVSLNGQNYFRVSDFVFRQPLVLDRDIPMSGPEKVETDVRLVGTGFRMDKRNADFKWGIRATEACPNEEVEDYRYHESSFLDTLAGDESLLAYKEEATNFERVDASMTEAGYYM